MTLKTNSLRLILLELALLLLLGGVRLYGQGDVRLTAKEIEAVLSVIDFAPMEIERKEQQLLQDPMAYYPELADLLRTSNNSAITKRILLLFALEKKNKGLVAPPVRDYLKTEWTAYCANPKGGDSRVIAAVTALGEIGDASDGEFLVSVLRQRNRIEVQLRQQTVEAVIKTSDQRTPGLLSSLLSGDSQSDKEILDARDQVIRHLQKSR